MQRRLGLARVLALRPRLLLVDEPTSGLDPEERVAFRDLLVRLADVAAVIVSTHIAADVEVSCSRMLVFLAGRIIWDGRPSELLAACEGRVRRCELADETAAGGLAATYRVTATRREEGCVTLRYLVEPDDPGPGEPCAPTLEEAYIDLVRRRTAS
jgi:ABC-2 type transport system ATP-binding protein